MSTATVPANARPMPTDRRSVLRSILAAGGVAAAAVPAVALAAAPDPLAETSDRRAVDLWSQRRALIARKEQLDRQYDEADAQMPAWARCGRKWLQGPGCEATNEVSGWPAIADATPPLEPGARLNVRPSRDEIRAEYEAACERAYRMPGGKQASVAFFAFVLEQDELRGVKVDPRMKEGLALLQDDLRGQPAHPGAPAARAAYDEAYRAYRRDIDAFEARIAAKEAEERRTGRAEVEAELERVWDRLNDLEYDILQSDCRGPHAVAAALMMGFKWADDSEAIENPAIFLGALRFVRPALTGDIAEDVDKLLADGGTLEMAAA